MEYRFLGSTGLRTSEIWLGCMNFGAGGRHLGDLDASASRALVDAALEAGINAFDVANVDAGGEAERLLGAALSGVRDEVVIATKVRLSTGPGPNDFGLSRAHIVREVDRSLERLGTDYIDLLQTQVWDAWTPIDETLRALDDLVGAGKVRYIGASNLAGWHLVKALACSEREGLVRYATVQARWSALEREAERELIPAASDHGVGVLAWSPLAGGLLSGKYASGQEPPPGSRLHHWPDIWERLDRPETWTLVEVLAEIAADRGVPMVQVALAALLAREELSGLIVGARTPEQLAETVGASEWSLDEEELELIDRASALELAWPHDVVARHNGFIE